MSASSAPARIHSLDGLRGVASVVVLVLHVAMMLEPWGRARRTRSSPAPRP